MAAGPNASVIWNAVYGGALGSVQPGDCVIDTGTAWLVATDANMPAGEVGIDGIALDQALLNGVFRVQVDGVIDPSILPDLGVGAATFVKRSSSGRLVRTTNPTDPDIVGRVRQNGRVILGLAGVATSGADPLGSLSVGGFLAGGGSENIDPIASLPQSGFLAGGGD